MTNTPISIGDAVSQIVTSPAPILFPDTCTLVDLIRVPLRVKTAAMAKGILDAASHLVTQSQTSPPTLWVVILPHVYEEWTEHSRSTTSELQRHWDRLDTKIEIAHISANSVNVALPTAITYSSQNIEADLLKLASDFFVNAIFLTEDPDCKNRAYTRVIKNEAPSRKGGGLKDCAIIEHCIEMCLQLRKLGFSESCVFTTSNKKDFCEQNSPVPKKPLDSQLSVHNISLTTNWQWARAELGI